MNARTSSQSTPKSGSGVPAPTDTSRRGFLKAGAVLTALTVGGKALASGGADGASKLSPGRMGVLVDLTRCVGCRRCEWACSDANANPHGTLEECDDQSVFATLRRPRTDQFCVVNATRNPKADPSPTDPPIFTKVQCMHCEYPPCVSACLVGAMEKSPEGPVTYDASKCIGCRYCMMACPFERLSYEYDRRFTPRVRKCELCVHRTREGKIPACVEICPVEALQYGKREDLLRIAHERIAAHPDRYVDRVYGETEGGGTSWLYLSARPFEQLVDVGLPRLPDKSPAERTEHIQHAIFKGAAGPLGVAALLTTLHFLTRKGGHA